MLALFTPVIWFVGVLVIAADVGHAFYVGGDSLTRRFVARHRRRRVIHAGRVVRFEHRREGA